eukprot:TRINITY_DN7288_c0_g1_i2.p1 TRINITY_DN7288_c0_g1~~TRINITY_DN7288_c0_g1_i2.p1  ORF type:complete len:409 (-),score=68.51 TRINITY_DN7288_c0_g1_i2:23-1138(-)
MASLSNLPGEILGQIIRFLPPSDAVSFALTFKKCWNKFMQASVVLDVTWEDKPVAIRTSHSTTVWLGLTTKDDTTFLWELTELGLTKHNLTNPSLPLFKPHRDQFSFSHCSAALIGDIFYQFGGVGEEDQTNDIRAFDLKKLTRESVYTSAKTLSVKGTPPSARLYSAIVPIPEKKKLVIIGGQCDAFGDDLIPTWYSDVHVFDIATKRWEKIEATGDVPKGRGAPSANLYGDKIIVFGGGSWEKTTRDKLVGVEYFNDTYSLCTKTWKWELLVTKGTAPCPRAGHASCVVGNQLLVTGGYVPEWVSFKDCFMLDLDTLTWRGVSPFCKVRGNHALCLGKGCVYTTSGIESWENNSYVKGLTVGKIHQTFQ